MLDLTSITAEDVLYQVKLLGQLPVIKNAIITRKVIQSSADKAGIEVIPEEIQKAANQFRKANNLLRAEETWKWMKDRGLELKEFEEIIYFDILKNKLMQHQFADQVEPYFAMHCLDFTAAAIYEMFLDDEDIALELFYRIKEGESTFYQVVQEYAQDRELKRKGGYRGFVGRAELPAELSAAVFGVSPPKLLRPITTSNGVHLIFVEEFMHLEFNNTLHQTIMNSLFSQWIEQEIKNFKLNQDSPNH